MTDLKLSALPNSTTITDSDQFYINSSGVSERIDASSVQQFINGQKVTSFGLNIKNDGGTLKHLMIGGLTTAAAGSYIDRIAGASNSLTITPTGTDSTTAFAGGGKISSASVDQFIFDTASQNTSDAIGIASLTRNTTGTHLVPIPHITSVDINGITQPRLLVQFFDSPGGTTFSLNTTNIVSGRDISVTIFAYLK